VPVKVQVLSLLVHKGRPADWTPPHAGGRSNPAPAGTRPVAPALLCC